MNRQSKKALNRARNRIRKLVYEHLGFVHNASFVYCGDKIRAITGWSGPSRYLVVRYYEEVMGGKANFPASEAKPDRPKKIKWSNWKERSEKFFESDAWKKLRYKALQICGAKCQCCGATQRDGVLLHVDHIKPRYHHPELELDLMNLQVLCADCNIGKGAGDDTDWRTDAERHMAEIVAKPS